MSDVKTNALKHGWWTERDAIAIVKRSEEDDNTTYLSVEEAKTVNIHAVKKDESFVATTGGDGSGGIRMDESSAIPEEFHEALANYAIAKGYELKPRLIRQASYFKDLFNQDVREGKRYANKGRDGTAYYIQGNDF